MHSKILFLDVDGVLNCINRWKGPHGKDLDTVCLDNLKSIVANTDCQIVLSSTWRILIETYTDLVDTFKLHNLSIMDKTPQYVGKWRADDINEWLANNPTDKFAILDDDRDAGFGLEEHFFKTSAKEGLTKEIADKVIQHLNR